MDNKILHQVKPDWLKKKIPSGADRLRVSGLILAGDLHTVCQEARCPNQGECFSRGTAAFLLLGNRCTRSCTFCAVAGGRPEPPDDREPEKVARVVREMGLSYCVLTSVTRDDLPDGGADQFGKTVEAIRKTSPGVRVECLIPDFQGSEAALDRVAEAGPCVISHNLETVPRLYPAVRTGADYRRSLTVLKTVKQKHPELLTKSGIMVGLGEKNGEVCSLLTDLREQGCDLLTIGQYLQPSAGHHPVAEYIPPEAFTQWERRAREMGFRAVASGPLVRSSYQAGSRYEQALTQIAAIDSSTI